jgi:alanyl-tRNA synthetase
MNADQIREAFLRFFEERGHRRMPSAPLVPPGDPTLLFTSAGMVQFKPYFMGQARAPNPRLTTVQKCFRTSDIDSVGDTSHLTFFEMLGNFSVGDYFKAEAIPWAWEFVTSKEWLGLDPDRLWAAVYLDDDEAFDLWRPFLPPERIGRYGEKDNYWFSGEVGPCGPCSELHYDFGPEFGCGPDCRPDHEDCDRFLEIWNLVFMTYFCDGEKRDPLPSKNIDTGAGLERMAVASLFESEAWPDKSKMPSVYDTDLFAPVIRRVEELSGKRYGEDAAVDRAIRIVAEHARAVTFLIGDERTPVIPSNEERGYAVRRVLRRAAYYGVLLGRGIVETKVWEDKGLWHILDRHARRVQVTELVPKIVTQMGPAYPEVINGQDFIQKTISAEEEGFRGTLDTGEAILRQTFEIRERVRELVNAVKPEALEHNVEDFFSGVPVHPYVERASIEPIRKALAKNRLKEFPFLHLPGEIPFTLHDTYGFPLELTREIAAERGFTVDEAGFEAEMEKQRERARAAVKGADAVAADQAYAALGDIETAFRGYDTLETRTTVLALLLSSARPEPVEGRAEVEAPAEVELFLAETPFYAESGGQVGDRGEVVGPNGRVDVEDTQKVAERLIVHRGRVVEGRIAVGDTVTARVDPERRRDTMRNHTGTHLLHAALRSVLGTHVRQAGSLVAPDYLRFDFTHTEAMTEEQIAEVQRLVNEKIRQDLPVNTRETAYDEAISEGVLAFFGEKYGEEVRVVEVEPSAASAEGGRFSAELCGGTHCHRTGEIGMLVITGESSIGAGMRRIEALTGRGAEEYVRDQQSALDGIARRLGAPRDAVPAKVEVILADIDAERKKVERLERALARGAGSPAAKRETYTVDGISVSAAEVEATSEQALRFMGDALKRELAGQGEGAAVAVIGAVIDGRPSFLAVASEGAASAGLTADALVREVARLAGGGGGGRPDMATGGAKDAASLSKALKQVPEVARRLLSGT